MKIIYTFAKKPIVIFNKDLVVLIPPKPINKFIYSCDNKFHPEHIGNLYDNFELYGVIMIYGDEVLFYNICGTEIKCVGKNKICLPNKHNKGGQSSKRFERLRKEKIQHYITYCEEMCRKHWIKDDQPIIRRLLLAGCDDKKERLYKILHPKLKVISERILCDDNIYNIYQNFIENDKYQDETKELEIFFHYIQMENNKAIYGKDEIIKKLEEYSLEKIIIHIDLLDDNLKDLSIKYNCEIITINNKSELSNIFIKGYGGIGAMTWY